MGKGRRRLLAVLAAACGLGALTAAPGAFAAEVTVGADTNQDSANAGTCTPNDAGNRPCVIVPTQIVNRTVTSPCDGTVVRWRMNGHPTANTYRLRVLRKLDDGSFMGVGSSAPASITVDGPGAPAFPTSLPIKTGDYLGIDFLNSSVNFGLRWIFATGLYKQNVFFNFPEDNAGSDGSPNFVEDSHYLFNGDVSCAEAAETNKCKKKKKKRKKKSAAAAKKKKKGCKKKKKRKKK